MAGKANRKRERERVLEAQRQRTQANRRKREMAQWRADSRSLLSYPVISRHAAIALNDMIAASAPVTPPEPPPVFSQCVVGYRTWTIDPFGRLRPKACDLAPWIPGVNTAKCKRDHFLYGLHYQFMGTDTAPTVHDAPAEDCDCGLYARFTASEVPAIEYNLDASKVTVMGAVAAWGNLRVHPDGIRAEKMCVTALALTEGMPAEIRDLVERVAAKYRVSAVAADMLQAEAEMHGMPLPDEHRPKRPI
jgi:hypothetical protein